MCIIQRIVCLKLNQSVIKKRWCISSRVYASVTSRYSTLFLYFSLLILLAELF